MNTIFVIGSFIAALIVTTALIGLQLALGLHVDGMFKSIILPALSAPLMALWICFLTRSRP